MTDEEDRLYNTKNLPGLETEIDPYTGNAKNAQYKYADESNYSKSGNVFDYFDEEDLFNAINDKNTSLLRERIYKKGTKLDNLQQQRLNKSR